MSHDNVLLEKKFRICNMGLYMGCYHSLAEQLNLNLVRSK